jgi:hypothetical protein
MIQVVDILIVIFGVAGFVAGHTVANRNKPPVITDLTLKRDLEYHRNLTDSLRQDVTDLRKRNNELLEKNYELRRTIDSE